MTLGIAWVGSRADGRKHLYLTSDSRTRGGMVLDCCPKILPLPRSDSAICFAGNTAATYPLMLQLLNAINAHQRALDRSLDIGTLKQHLLRVFTDILRGIVDAAAPIETPDVQFIFAGYSWMAKRFRIWTIYYSEKDKCFRARDSVNFRDPIRQVAFIGDRGHEARSLLMRRLLTCEKNDLPVSEYEPFCVLRDMLRGADMSATIGGAPQIIRIGEHMNTRVLAIEWPADSRKITLMGRELNDYENTDNWILHPDTLELSKPRSFGNRSNGDLDNKSRSEA